MEYLVAGLGNIGSEYASTRHNIGFMVLDAWAKASNAVFRTRRYGDVAEVNYKGRKFVLLKPSTYMNLSGNAVRFWLRRLRLPVENLIVICDDINLPFGSIRMRTSGSDGGHNGLFSVADMIDTEQFTRIRFGIGNDFERGGQIDYVLGKLSEDEIKLIEETSARIIEGIELYSTAGKDRAMTFLNTKKV